MNDILSEMRALPHVSVSQLKCFIQCPRRFRLRYIDRAEAAFRAVALAFGTAWHRTIGHMLVTHAEGNTTGNGELHDYLRGALEQELHTAVPVLFDDDEPEGTLVDRAMTMLTTFIEKYELPEKVLGVEVPSLALGEVGEHAFVGAEPLVGKERGE